MIDLKWKEEVKGNPISNWLGRPDLQGQKWLYPAMDHVLMRGTPLDWSRPLDDPASESAYWDYRHFRSLQLGPNRTASLMEILYTRFKQYTKTTLKFENFKDCPYTWFQWILRNCLGLISTDLNYSNLDTALAGTIMRSSSMSSSPWSVIQTINLMALQ